ncbi:Arylsulfatase A [Novosphingobium sp. CF614]|uniref:sulfatase-like hydrolase/transferase n=1 Tax=Novosphingobium sp. CF614 TaxID=1884364 RepID=UPI0008E245B0|nr:sulfatase-like hydrolase/transferase [Novosphingobium sp. CF614]SFG42897.1 Arylsulfatase A [Novosphingobium sp. CF614]
MRAGTNRRTLLKWLGATTAIVALPGAGRAYARSTSAIKKPNILFILVDDMGYADLSATGSSHIKTPAIDGLARDGVLLTQGYSSTPICSPTRTALLTGCWAQRFPVGVEEPLGPNAPIGIGVPSERPTIASVLRNQGYHTKLIGKWHLGEPPKHGPLQHGYDEFFGIVEGAADYFRHHIVVEGREVGMGLSRGNSPIEAGGYLTDLFGAEAVDTIEKSGDTPFFLSLHFNAPHWPWEGREDAEAAKTIPNSFHYDGGNLTKYHEMMEAMDQNVARVLDALEKSGKAQDTIVVFTSDNGGERFSQTWPYVGHKGEVLEGGVHVPVIVRWPGHIAPGTQSRQVMASMDFLPTLLAMAGGSVAKAGTFDGVDLSRQFTGQSADIERTLFWRFKANEQAAVRKGDWKYVRIDGRDHLFNLAEDEHERAERGMAEPAKLDELKRLWDDWNRQMVPYRVDGYSEDVKKNYIDRY